MLLLFQSGTKMTTAICCEHVDLYHFYSYSNSNHKWMNLVYIYQECIFITFGNSDYILYTIIITIS